MKRHLLVGRCGVDDRESINVGVDELQTNIDFICQQGKLKYGIQKVVQDALGLGLMPSEIGVDLLLLAAHVYAADTRISRNEQAQDTWTREIRIAVPVSDPVLWGSVAEILVHQFGFLTGDRWEFNFRSRPKQFERIVPVNNELLPHRFDSLSLFSGGLDSLVGVINLLEKGATTLLVSHAGDSSASSAQYKLFEELKKEYGGDKLKRLRAAVSFPQNLIQGVSSEKSTRGRSFLFFALGVFAGIGFGRRFTLYVPENGFIALNVPLDPLRLGANSTRTTHPYYMELWNTLLDKLGVDGEVVNPYWNKTKGEMIAQCKNRVLFTAIYKKALSCSSPAKGRFLGHTMQHCGYCLPCLIRRASLEMALGSGNDKTIYTLDNSKHPVNAS